MKNLSTDTHAHDPATDQELFELLKEAQVPGESPGDDNESTVGVNPAPVEDETPEGSIDASWGQKDIDGEQNDAIHHGDEVVKRFREGREDLLDKLFDSKKMSDGAEQQLIGSHLDHYKSGDFESRAPQIKTESKIQKTASTPQTLMERVRDIAGRH